MLGEIFGLDGIVVVLVVVVVLFGGAAIPKFARNLGSAKKEFEKGIADGHKEDAAGGASTNGSSPSTAARSDDTGVTPPN